MSLINQLCYVRSQEYLSLQLTIELFELISKLDFKCLKQFCAKKKKKSKEYLVVLSASIRTYVFRNIFIYYLLLDYK